MKIKALFYTSDPYEPSGLLGVFNTEEEKQNILRNIAEIALQDKVKWYHHLDDENYNDYLFQIREEEQLASKKEALDFVLKKLTDKVMSAKEYTEKEIEIGVGKYWS